MRAKDKPAGEKKAGVLREQKRAQTRPLLFSQPGLVISRRRPTALLRFL